MEKMVHNWQDIVNKPYNPPFWKKVKNLIIGDYKSGGILGVYYWIRGHVWQREHIINISGEDRYRWGYIDTDYKMLLACFKLLKDFVELEDPNVGFAKMEDFLDMSVEHEQWELDSVKEQIVLEKEIRELYTWWTEIRPAEHVRCGALLDSWLEKGKHWVNERERLDNVDEEMLQRLMKIRKRLWT